MISLFESEDLALLNLEVKEPEFSSEVTQLLEERYFMAYPGETPEKETSWLEISRRVARVIAAGVHKGYEEANKSIEFHSLAKIEDLFFKAIALRLFIPSSPILYNAGMGLPYKATHDPINSIEEYKALWESFTPAQQLASCFTGSDVGDSVEAITQTAAEISTITKGDGGYGINLSKLRPQGARVKSNNRQASGPVSFMPLFNTAASVIQFSRRRGALMGVLNHNHPDIMKFINAKDKGETLDFFNISVGFTEEFDAIRESITEKPWEEIELELYHPETGTSSITFKEFMDAFASQVYETGDPGILMLNNTNRYYVFPVIKVTSCNPCSEKAMPENMSCNLGSVNVYDTFTTTLTEDHWRLFDELTALGVVFLDACINATSFPTKKIQENVKKFRPLGLGIMGIADLAVAHRVLYREIPKSYLFWDLMLHFSTMAYITSAELGDILDVAPAYKELGFRPSLPFDFMKEKAASLAYSENEKNVWDYIQKCIPLLEEANNKPRRNSEVLSIAPTGAISTIANVSWSIEPHYSKSYVREAYSNDKPIEIEVFVRSLRDFGDSLPCETALQLSPEHHIAALEFFQMFIDSGVSKTINMRKDVTKKDVLETLTKILINPVIKGATIYRDGSKHKQVVVTKEEETNGTSDTLVLSIGKDNRLKPVKRKEFLPGMIHRSRLDNGDAMFTIVTFDGSRPIETFIIVPDNRYDALAKIISKALRAGTSWDVLMKTLAGTSDRFVGERLSKTKEAWENFIKRVSKDKPRCPSCGTELETNGSSMECPACDYAICLTC